MEAFARSRNAIIRAIKQVMGTCFEQAAFVLQNRATGAGGSFTLPEQEYRCWQRTKEGDQKQTGRKQIAQIPESTAYILGAYLGALVKAMLADAPGADEADPMGHLASVKTNHTMLVEHMLAVVEQTQEARKQEALNEYHEMPLLLQNALQATDSSLARTLALHGNAIMRIVVDFYKSVAWQYLNWRWEQKSFPFNDSCVRSILRGLGAPSEQVMDLLHKEAASVPPAPAKKAKAAAPAADAEVASATPVAGAEAPATATPVVPAAAAPAPVGAKRPLNAFQLYCADHRASTKQAHSGAKGSEVSSLLGAQWKALPEADQKPYKDKAEALKAEAKSAAAAATPAPATATATASVAPATASAAPVAASTDYDSLMQDIAM